MSETPLQKAVRLAGGQAHLARKVRALIPDSKIGQVHVWGWLHSAKKPTPPAEVVLAIAESIDWKVTPHELRQDIYPHPTDGMRGTERKAA